MVERKIDLRKVRDFGECISDAFVFIRQNAAPLLKSFFAICTVFMLAQAIYTGIFQSSSFNILNTMFNGRPQNILYFWSTFGPRYLLLIVLGLLTLVSMQVALGAYVKYYAEHHEQPGIEEVWALFTKYFLTMFLYNIPVLLSIIVGAVFCFIPGIYLGIVLMPFALVVMIEDKDIFAAYRRCFELIRENFWMSFGIYFVAYLIYGVGSLCIGLIVSMIGGLLAYLTTADMATSLGVVTSFLNIFSLSFYVIFYICVAMNYFSLVEKKDGTGLINRIDTIGSNPSAWKDTEDQY